MKYVIRTTQTGITYAKYRIDREAQEDEEEIHAALYQEIEVPCAIVWNRDGTYTIAPAEPPVFEVEVDPLPDPAPPPEPTESEDVSALLVDHEYRLTLLELGVI